MAITGRSAVSLTGFVREEVPLAWLRLDQQVIEPTGSVDAIATLEQRRRSAHRWLIAVTILIATVAVAALGVTVGARLLSPPYEIQQAVTDSRWTVTQIHEDSLTLDFAGASVLVAVGQSLPNGETLRRTLPAEGVYWTDTSNVSIQRLSSRQSPPQSGPDTP